MTTIYTPFADGRTVRDIVEHSPALVNETWCRDLLRHTLDSLERQYATGAPHRPISPDTIVMLANNEPLLLPAPDEVGPAGAATMAADLHALALLVHYAITAELPPDGPLGPRLYDDYSPVLTNGLDRCLGPNLRLRPKTVDDMRTLLGIEAAAGAQPAHASTLAGAAAQTAVPEPVSGHAPLPEPVPVVSATRDGPAAGHVHAPVPEPLAEPLAEPAAAPRLHTPSTTGLAAGAPPAPARRAEPAPTTAAAAAPAPLLRTPAEQATALEAATAARLREEAARKQASAAVQPRARPGSVQRWGWIAGAAIVLLAAGSALVSYLQQGDARDAAVLSLPAEGLEPARPATAAATDGTGSAASGDSGAAQGTEAVLLTDDPAMPENAAEAVMTGKPGEPVVDGITYKLLIKPWGTVYVDDIDRGVSPPVKRLTLSRGQHTIRIVNPAFPDHVMTIDAGKRGSTTIDHDFTATAKAQ